MMNALPLPNGSMEILGGRSKPGRPLPNSEKSGGAEGGSSFASTLKAVHDHRRTPNDAFQTEDGEGHEGRETNETQAEQPIDEKSEAASHDMPAEATPSPLSPRTPKQPRQRPRPHLPRT